MVVADTTPEDRVRVSELAKPVVVLVETSNPEGGVTEISPARSVPLAEKLVLDELVPYVVVKAANVPLVLIVGVGATVALLKVSPAE